MFVDVKTAEEQEVVLRAECIESITQEGPDRLLVRMVSGSEITVMNYPRDQFIRDLRDSLRRR